MAIPAATAYAEHSNALRGHLAAYTRDSAAAEDLLLSAHGFSGAEIARHIGRSELATRSLICRHRSRLRDSLVAA